MNFFDRLKYEYNKGSMIIKLIMINVGVFVIINIVFAFGTLFNTELQPDFIKWFAVHSNLDHLVYTPWTIVTAGFIHAGLFHILFNMLWLYWIGRILEEYIGSRKILPLYIYSVIVGSLFFIIAYNVFPFFQDAVGNATAVGASAAVAAVVWATVTLLPNHKIRLFLIGTVPLIYIAAFMSIWDLMSIAGDNAGGAIAHLGGALMGYLYIKSYQSGNDLSKGFNYWMDKIATLFQGRKQPKMKVEYSNTKKTTQNQTKIQREKSKEKKLNTILDKIGQSGYDSLSKEEKEFLFNQSSKN